MGKRIILLVMDSAGIGAMPDSDQFGDQGSHTLKHVAQATGGLHLPTLEALGLGRIDNIPHLSNQLPAWGAFGKAAEASKGKDTTTGHWEMMGIITQTPFPTYPHGFPVEIITAFEQAIGRPSLGNTVASGTVIIEELGMQHMQTGYPIVYTSADSVFQIAAHENIIPLPELYDMCQKARSILQPPHAVGRVIARPFTGKPGNFVRTANRHDFSLVPGNNVLDAIQSSGQAVYSIGKISDIFAGKSISEGYRSTSNSDGMKILRQCLQQYSSGLFFINLIDFDQKYGHRNDAQGYAQALEEMDADLKLLLPLLSPQDLLIITADHGCDPTFPGTDHTREYVPILTYWPTGQANINLGTRLTFADIGQTIADFMGVSVSYLPGHSFYPLLKGD